MRLLSVLLLAFVLSHKYVPCYGYDCDEGCALDNDINGGLVCGEDGFSYPNECFAICQGVIVTKNRTCLSITTDTVMVTTGFITRAVMTRFKSDGYKFVRQVDYSKLDGDVRQPTYTEPSLDTMSNVPPISYSHRLTIEGYEYFSNRRFRSTVTGSVSRSLAPFDPQAKHRRELRVIGRDTRKKVKDTTKFPFKLIGGLGPSIDTAYCPAIIISNSSVLTSAACVYDSQKKKFITRTYFAPARYGKDTSTDADEAVDPYGRWEVDYITTPSEYIKTAKQGFDFAVVTLKKDNTDNPPVSIGEFLGYIGLEEASGFRDPLLDGSSFIGYPRDVEGPRTMWTTGKCRSGMINATRYFRIRLLVRAPPYGNPDAVALHNCDVSLGTSGSPLLGTDNIVRGINTFGISGLQGVLVRYNGAINFIRGNGVLDDVMMWAGIST